jgi:hypothetical protein
MNTDNDIIIPLRHYEEYPKNFTSIDGPRPVFTIEYFGLIKQISQRTDPALISITNEEQFTIKPLQSKTLTFNTIIFTSIEARSLVYADNLLYRYGLTYDVSNIPTNDTFLFIKIYNTLSTPLTFVKHMLSFNCLTILAKT